MSRNILDGMNVPEEKDDRKEYKAPEEKLVDSGLVKLLLEHYEKKSFRVFFDIAVFDSEVQKLKSIIKDKGCNFNSQTLIDSLILKLAEDSDSERFRWSTDYLTAVVQALYDLGYSSEFTIDIRQWPEERYEVGFFLKGKPDRPLVLNLYGNFSSSCCAHTEYCSVTFYNQVRACGIRAKHSNFTFYEPVRSCGYYTEHCTFNLMPNAKITSCYKGNILSGTIVKRLNDKGRVRIIPTMWSNLVLSYPGEQYHLSTLWSIKKRLLDW